MAAPTLPPEAERAEQPPSTLLDLPDEVLALVASLGLTESRDVASFAAASKRCRSVCRSAPLRLALPVRGLPPQQEQAAARSALQALCAAWPGTAELDLRGCPLEDRDVAAALHALPGLAVLHLDGCKKLTPRLLAAGGSGLLVAGRSSGAGSRQPGGVLRAPLRTVTLQRCFQLTAAGLWDVLAGAAAPGSKLSCAALSHLTMADWRAAGPGSVPSAPSSSPPAGQLRMLALHNCAKLGGSVLAAVAAACPRLEVLMLGGCTYLSEEPAGTADGGSSGSSSGSAESSTAGQPAHLCQLHERALATLLEGVPARLLRRAGAAPGSSFVGYVAGVAARLAAAAASLPRLRVLEVTHGLPGLVPALQQMAATEPLLLTGRERPLQVWDLCSPCSVAQALQWQRDVATSHSSPSSAGAGRITPADAAAFLAAAANCSSGSRATPLHTAAEEGDGWLLSSLLRLGSAVDAREKGGGTPLFLACEAGLALSVEALLAAGASPTLRNSAGESPLYIACLKGHERCAELLLAHSQLAEKLAGDGDGDGWTPLMAAVVGGRTSIVLKLLAAAGQAAPALVLACNRYGQNAVHIAARKAPSSLLASLLDAGGASPVLAPDADGRLPSDIARRNNNGAALRLLADAGAAACSASALRREQARQRGMVPTAERPRAHDHRQQHQAQQRWVGRRLSQRKGGAGGGGGAH